MRILNLVFINMLFKKKGLPEDDELVLCTVTKIQYNSVFAKLDEYDRYGMIQVLQRQSYTVFL